MSRDTEEGLSHGVVTTPTLPCSDNLVSEPLNLSRGRVKLLPVVSSFLEQD